MLIESTTYVKINVVGSNNTIVINQVNHGIFSTQRQRIALC